MIYITHEKSVGRSGHQFKDAITPLIIAEIFGFTFVHNEHRGIQLFNLGEGRLLRENLPSGITIHYVDGPHWKGASYEQLLSDFAHLQDQYMEKDCLVILRMGYRVQLFQTHIWRREGLLKRNLYDHVVTALRKNFQSKNPRNVISNGKIHIAVHIRRGDVAAKPKGRKPSSQHYAHSMEYYDSIVETLKKSLSDREINIHIFTEVAHADDVVEYCRKKPDVTLHQGAKAEFADHFARMVYSDILVVSNSSMSQMAGYLSEGLKIYHPNDQYHDLPEDQFIPFNEVSRDKVLQHLKLRR